VRLGCRAVALTLLLALVGTLVACSDGGDAIPPAGDDTGAARAEEAPTELRIGVAGVGSLDPAQVSAASPSQTIVADLLYDGLTAFDASTNAVVGAVARSWSANADATAWMFQIDSAATFSDGTPVTSTDVKATLERVAALGVKSLAGVRLSAIDGYDGFLADPAVGLSGIAAPDPATVVITLRTPFASFDELLTDPAFGIVPATGGDATSGPFRIEARAVETIEAVRRDGSGATLDTITLRLYADTTAAYDAFERGDVDLSVLASDEVAAASAAGALVMSAPQQVSLFYGMNLASPVLSSPGLRRAIVKAVDSNGIRSAAFGDAADTMTGLFGPGVAAARSNACGSACAYDPDEARSIVAAAYPAGGVPTVHVDFYEDLAGREAAIAQAIVDDLVAVGIPAEARATTFDAYGQLLTSGAAELFRFGWIGAYPSPDAYLDPLFATGGSDNVFSVSDAELDGLLATARSQVDDASRSATYMAAEDRALALDAVVPIVRYRAHLVATDRVHGVVLAPNGSFDVERVVVD
jgi:oligopeptide transport system substrate-binding protein